MRWQKNSRKKEKKKKKFKKIEAHSSRISPNEWGKKKKV